MDALIQLYLHHGFWAWAGLAAGLLAIEVALGSGYLLWPSAAAGAVALVVLTGLSPGLPAELGLFAILTTASSLLAHHFFRRKVEDDGPDINAPQDRLVGRTGRAVGPLVRGEGRVFVEGKEWAAQSDADLADGDVVEVVAIMDGAALKVRRVPA